MRPLVADCLAKKAETTAQSHGAESALHLLAYPVRDADGGVRGVLVVVHDSSHLEDRSSARMSRYGL